MTKLLRAWQLRTSLLIGLLLPPLATFIFLEWGTVIDLSGSLGSRLEQLGVVALGSVAISFIGSYKYGLIPALLVGAMYCGLLTLVPSLMTRRIIRVCVLAILGAVVAFLWAWFDHGVNPLINASMVAAAGALLALRWPRPLA